MDATRKKILRLQRLRTLEQSKLNSLAIELAAIESVLTDKSKQLSELHSQIEDASTLNNEPAIALHAQSLIWIRHLVSCRDILQTEIRETESKRDKMLAETIQQKAKVRGWESLIDRLNAELAGQLQNRESLLADERFLNISRTR